MARILLILLVLMLTACGGDGNKVDGVVEYYDGETRTLTGNGNDERYEGVRSDTGETVIVENREDGVYIVTPIPPPTSIATPIDITP